MQGGYVVELIIIAEIKFDFYKIHEKFFKFKFQKTVFIFIIIAISRINFVFIKMKYFANG